MGGKFSPIIIGVLIVVVIAIGVLIYTTLTTDSSTGNKVGNQPGTSQEETSKPVLNLSKKYDGDSPKEVTINVTATPNEENEIQEIILPDGTSVMGATAEYVVKENGEYEFTALCVDGVSDSLKIEVSEIAEISATNPYIPEGFTQIEGTEVDSGFVIEDKYGNQYVWVPVASGKLTRKELLNPKYEESSTTASALVNSVAKYYGFYIGRFEASQYELNGNQVAASMEGKIPWTNITYTDAENYANGSAKAFEYEDSYTALINSYSWDTVLEWIEKDVTNFSSNTNYGNYSGTIYPTGYTEKDRINSICDLAGNIREWTTEIYKETPAEDKNKENVVSRVVRGGSANLSRTPGSHIGYADNKSDTYWGFRMILYK